MVDTALDMLRRDALVTQVKGVPGGNRIAWSAKDIATMRDHIMALTPEKITAPTAVRKFKRGQVG
jgi:DNA-binding IscR family transcriptional regulator